jgi:hypothetical protein
MILWRLDSLRTAFGVSETCQSCSLVHALWYLPVHLGGGEGCFVPHRSTLNYAEVNTNNLITNAGTSFDQIQKFEACD